MKIHFYKMLVYLLNVGLFIKCWFIYKMLGYLLNVGLFIKCWFIYKFHWEKDTEDSCPQLE